MTFPGGTGYRDDDDRAFVERLYIEQAAADISPGAIAKLGRNENVVTAILARICNLKSDIEISSEIIG